MDQFFDKLGDWLKSILSEEDGKTRHRPQSHDADYQDAWNELDDFLKTGKSEPKPDFNRDGTQNRGPVIPEDLRVHYKTLNLRFGASLEEVKKAYKKIISLYHPDKHAGNAEARKIATEKTQELNSAYAKLEAWFEARKI